MTKKLRTSYLLPTELAETTNSFMRAINDVGLKDPFIDRITALLQDDLKELNQAITAVRSIQLVNEVASADAVRDDLFIGFRDIVDAYRRRRDPKFKEAHGQVWPIIEQAGTTLYALGYADQSGKLEALFAELDKEENQSMLSRLNAKGIYKEMKQAQADFIDIYSNRLDAESGIDYPTLQEAKRRTVPHINGLLSALGILDETEPGKHAKLMDKVGSIITAIMSTARARKSREETSDVEV